MTLPAATTRTMSRERERVSVCVTCLCSCCLCVCECGRGGFPLYGAQTKNKGLRSRGDGHGDALVEGGAGSRLDPEQVWLRLRPAYAGGWGHGNVDASRVV
jgi:hypothetical protein